MMNSEDTIAEGPVSIAAAPPVARFNLRVRAGDIAAASTAFGVTLPQRVGQGAHADGRSAWALGPDEWLLHAQAEDAASIVDAFASIRAVTPHSLVDISDREVTFVLEGERVEELLTIGCPINLRRLAPGAAKRTIFDTAQIVLLRDAPDRFRIEVWRSFASHVEDLLRIGDAELASGF
jgi:sarcosine oxidase subunit gamma